MILRISDGHIIEVLECVFYYICLDSIADKDMALNTVGAKVESVEGAKGDLRKESTCGFRSLTVIYPRTIEP